MPGRLRAGKLRTAIGREGFEEQMVSRLAGKFEDEIRFFRGWLSRPKTVGSIVPTSTIAARSMASVVRPDSGLPVLEIGPGTGVITRQILARGVAPQNLYLVEYCEDFVVSLRNGFAGVNVIEGDAFHLDTTLGDMRDAVFDCVVSGMPLLNFPVAQRIALVESVLDRVPPGRPLIQFTYGPRPPAPAGGGNYKVAHYDFVLRNIPPARLWTYSR